MDLRWIDARPNPITLAEAQAHLRVDTNDEDTLISSLVTAGTDYLEEVTGRALVSGTLQITRPDLPSVIPLPRSPVSSLVSIVLTDDAGATTTLDAGTYLLDTTSLPHRLVRSSTATLPSLTLSRANAVRITVVAGYGAASAVPEALKAAHKLFVSNYFENRQPVVVGTIATELPFAFKALVAPYTIRVEEPERDCADWRRAWY